MGTTQFNKIPHNADLQTLINMLNYILDDLDFLLNGHMDTKNIRELTADKITAGQILTAIITIMGALSNGGFIRIDDQGITINDGTKDTFKVGMNGKPIMTGGTVQSSPGGYPNVVFDSGQNQITATQEAGVSISLSAGGFPGSAQLLNFEREGLVSQIGMIQSGIGFAAALSIISIAGVDIKINAGKDIYLGSGTDKIYLESFANTVDLSTSQTLQAALNSKANAFSGFTGNITVMTSPTTSITQHFVNGILSFIS